jgi:hypothetical protein
MQVALLVVLVVLLVQQDLEEAVAAVAVKTQA